MAPSELPRIVIRKEVVNTCKYIPSSARAQANRPRFKDSDVSVKTAISSQVSGEGAVAMRARGIKDNSAAKPAILQEANVKDAEVPCNGE